MSTVVSNVGFRTQTTFLWIANGISGTVAVNLAGNYTDALDVRIRIWYGAFWASTGVGTFVIGACSAMATGV